MTRAHRRSGDSFPENRHLRAKGRLGEESDQERGGVQWRGKGCAKGRPKGRDGVGKDLGMNEGMGQIGLGRVLYSMERSTKGWDEMGWDSEGCR